MTKTFTTFQLFILLLIGSFVLQAQQDPQFTQYMYNMSVINPAYATADDTMINFGTLYRSQWVGAVGGPTTGTFFGHAKFTDRLEGGISIVHDQIGDVVNETSAFIDVAYVLPVSLNSRLSFGIKAGASFFNTDFNGFVYSDPLPDPAFAENISRTFPNIGAGVFYFSDTYYVGFSVPNLLQSEHLDEDSGIVTQGTENAHLFLTGGYVFNLNSNLKLKPAFLARQVDTAPISLDITANVLINDKFEAGVGYRFDDSVSGLFNVKILPNLRVGYAYDYTLTNLGRFNSGSHEIFILFDVNRIITKGFDKSPRFF